MDMELDNSVNYLKFNHPTLVNPFLNALQELKNSLNKRKTDFTTQVESTHFKQLCMTFALALSECASEFKPDVFIYVPYPMHYQIRFAPVKNIVRVVNFLKPLRTEE